MTDPPRYPRPLPAALHVAHCGCGCGCRAELLVSLCGLCAQGLHEGRHEAIGPLLEDGDAPV